MEQHKYNIIDIARLAQMSTATILRVLHEKGGYSRETETRVRRIIAECGFQLDKNARGLQTQKSRNIGVIVPDTTSEFFARIIHCLELFFPKHQYSVLIYDSHEGIRIEQLHIRNLKEQQVEGTVYISGGNTNPIQESAFPIPIVYIDRKPEDVHIFVHSGNRQGGYLVARGLIEKQCRSILLLKDQRKASTIRQRRSSYLKVPEKAGIASQESWEITTKNDYTGVLKTITNLLVQKSCFLDDVFATSDNIALAYLHALYAQHIQAPDQVKIVGFDNVLISQFYHPVLTTIIQNTELMTEATGDALLKQIHYELDKQEFIIPASLCVREPTWTHVDELQKKRVRKRSLEGDIRTKPMFNPSFTCMDLLEIREQIQVLNLYADFYHIDIMDGHFVKNIILSPDFVKAVARVNRVPLDCHLTVTHSDDYITTLAQVRAALLSPHAETIDTDAFHIFHKIHELGCRTGIVLNPATPLSYIRHYFHLLDKTTIVSIDPGFAGQTFIHEMLDEIKEAEALRLQYGYRYLVGVDGPCNTVTFQELRQVGVEVFIAGNSGLFQFNDNLHVA